MPTVTLKKVTFNLSGYGYDVLIDGEKYATIYQSGKAFGRSTSNRWHELGNHKVTTSYGEATRTSMVNRLIEHYTASKQNKQPVST